MDTKSIKTLVQFSPKDGKYWLYFKRESDNCYTKWRPATEKEIKEDKEKHYGNV